MLLHAGDWGDHIWPNEKVVPSSQWGWGGKKFWKHGQGKVLMNLQDPTPLHFLHFRREMEIYFPRSMAVDKTNPQSLCRSWWLVSTPWLWNENLCFLQEMKTILVCIYRPFRLWERERKEIITVSHQIQNGSTKIHLFPLFLVLSHQFSSLLVIQTNEMLLLSVIFSPSKGQRYWAFEKCMINQLEEQY